MAEGTSAPDLTYVVALGGVVVHVVVSVAGGFVVKCCRATSQEIEPSDGLGGDLLITFRVRGPTDPRPVSLLVESVAERSGDSGADASKRLRLGNRVCDAGNQAVRSSSGCLAIVALGVSPGGSAKVEPMAEVVRTTAPRTRWVFLSRDACHLGLCRLVALARPTQEHSTEYARSGPTLVSVASRVHVRFVQAVAPMPATAVDVVAGWWSRTVHRWCGQLCLRHTLEGALTRSCILSTGCRRFLKSEHDGKTWLCARPSCCIIHNSNNNMAAELPTATGGEARASPGTAPPPPRDRPGRPLPGFPPLAPRADQNVAARLATHAAEEGHASVSDSWTSIAEELDDASAARGTQPASAGLDTAASARGAASMVCKAEPDTGWWLGETEDVSHGVQGADCLPDPTVDAPDAEGRATCKAEPDMEEPLPDAAAHGLAGHKRKRYLQSGTCPWRARTGP